MVTGGLFAIALTSDVVKATPVNPVDACRCPDSSATWWDGCEGEGGDEDGSLGSAMDTAPTKDENSVFLLWNFYLIGKWPVPIKNVYPGIP